MFENELKRGSSGAAHGALPLRWSVKSLAKCLIKAMRYFIMQQSLGLDKSECVGAAHESISLRWSAK